MNDFDRTEVENLKRGVNLAELMRNCGIELRQVGKNLAARCPWHDDGEASLVVNPGKNLFNCFGCEAQGDVLSFLQLHYGIGFLEALDRLRGLAGGSVGPVARSEAASKDELPGGLTRPQLLGRVAELYARRFFERPEARDYLEGRGLGSRELWEAFKVGYCDGSLAKTLPADGEVRQALKTLGVLGARGREHFLGCVVVPLEHPDLGVVGLYGRKLDPGDRVRHLFLPGPKRGVLHWQMLTHAPEVVLCEGVLDVFSLWQAGVKNATCLCGTASLGQDLEELLGRYAVRRVVFCLDADAAGRKAVARLTPQLVARGFSSAVVELPEGRDPNAILVEHGSFELASFCEAPTGAQAPDTLEKATFEKDGFSIELGGTRYEMKPRPPFAGRLRVTLRAVGADGKKFVDTLDLYSHRARAATVRQLSARLELAAEVAEAHLARLLDEGERWVGSCAETAGGAEPAREQPSVTAEEREEALVFLRRPDLVEAVLEDMEALGYVGERRGKLLVYLIGLSRKLERPLAGIIISQSGAGKSGLTDVIEQLTPPEDVVLYSRISAQALGYLPKDFLKRKLLILEERVGGEAADYQIRVLQSRQKLSQLVVLKDPVTGTMQTRHFEVEGPIAYLETTTSANINHENATRCFEVRLDESEEQTRRVQERQRQARTLSRISGTPGRELVCRRHHNAQRQLERLKVIIPYVGLLSFPSRWLRTRRDNERFLCLVEAVAFLHQHQRRRGTVTDATGHLEMPYVEATVADYAIAYELAQEVLRATLHELTSFAQELLGAIQEMVSKQDEEPHQVAFTRKRLRALLSWPDRRLRETLAELVEMEYLGVLEGSRGRAYRYFLVPDEDDGSPVTSGLTTPEELEARLAERRPL